MNFLLDTHTLIWFITNDRNLPASLKSKIADSSNGCYVSSASIWEIVIKNSIGKLELTTTVEEVLEILKENDIAILTIELPHILQVGTLPLHHRDPFDRIIIAQAKIENLVVITKDEAFFNYDVVCLWRNSLMEEEEEPLI